ncbi:MAG: hypothetical protein J5662_08360 [Clostridia bacterium]|nr:hypothetical protein [Clostridia bacterium]
MHTAAALLAGGVTFFAGFLLGLYPPIKPKSVKRTAQAFAGQNEFFEKFLNYNGEMMP